MMSHCAPLPSNEILRLCALGRLDILDTASERAYDDIVFVASATCNAPIALVSLVDRNRQWFKASLGINAHETRRENAFCAHAILEPEHVMVVENALEDARFMHNPLVLGDPFIRFYAGAPIVTQEGYALGTVCVIDTIPRTINSTQREVMKALARNAAYLMQLPAWLPA